MSVSVTNDYVLGSSNAEHERLMKQARTIQPFTDRLLRDAGIRAGQRALDIGAGVGDVSLLLAKLVGDDGLVCGIDADESALAKARARGEQASLRNLVFLFQDLNRLDLHGTFDAVVGRLVLMFLPAMSRIRILNSLAKRLNPGGVIVFQEPSWSDFFAHARHLPLHAACGRLICETLSRAGAEPDMAVPLHHALAAARWLITTIRVDVPLATTADDLDWTADLFATLRPRMDAYAIDYSLVGDVTSLPQRMRQEVVSAGSFGPVLGLVGVIARKAS